MNNTNQNTFNTDSFLLASHLLANSCVLLTLNKTNPRRVVFVFKDSETRRKLTEDFLSHKSLVEPHKFYGAQKDLKQMLYQAI